MSLFDGLDPVQRAAVEAIEGPVAVYAGAGSGKTRVMTHRVAYMVDQGIHPENILCITFTNKAANEMRERIHRLVEGSDGMWIGTFHKTCSLLLRSHAHRLGMSPYFTVLDSPSQKSVLKDVANGLGFKLDKVKEIHEHITFAKQKTLDANGYYDYLQEHAPTNAGMIRDIYKAYQERLERTNSVDFEDLLLKTVKLLQESDDAREEITGRFRYISVDEYQDTSYVDSVLISLLAGSEKNVMAVGDPRQTVFRFRGSDMWYLMNFTKDYGARLFTLDTNYRSGANIVYDAESLVSHNTLRPDYTCRPVRTGGSVMLREFDYSSEEARFVSSEIRRLHTEGLAYEDMAILYRVNAVRTALEPVLIERQIPYNIVNGVQFAERKGVQDVASYLRLLANSDDDEAMTRAMGVPSWGIGEGAYGEIRQLADSRSLSLHGVLQDPLCGTLGPRALRSLEKFRSALSNLKSSYDSDATVSDLIDGILALGFEDHYRKSDKKAADRHLEAVYSLVDYAARYPGPAKETLLMFLEDLALGPDVDAGSPGGVKLMTVHASKGLEFKAVFLVGCEEGMFPHGLSTGDLEDVEEERRLMYVAMTRAVDHLYMTSAFSRVLNGRYRDAMPSPFLREINQKNLRMAC